LELKTTTVVYERALEKLIGFFQDFAANSINDNISVFDCSFDGSLFVVDYQVGPEGFDEIHMGMKSFRYPARNFQSTWLTPA
jgi:hypothetical protein